MSSGILGQSNPTASANTTVYTVPASVTSSFAVNFCNLSGATATVSLAVSASGTPANSEFVLYNQTVPGFTTVEKTGLVANTGKNVVVTTSTSSIAVSVYGYEG